MTWILAILLLFVTPSYAQNQKPPLASQVRTDTTSFSKNLSTSDVNVQHALETLDQLTAGGGSYDGTIYGWTRTGTNVHLTNVGDNVGINSVTPQAKLDVEGSVYFGSTNPDVRLMWISPKGALRVGQAVGDNWDDVNVGQYSVAFGDASKASGIGSLAISGGISSGVGAISGGTSIASGDSSFALGSNSVASGDISFVIGNESFASGDNSFAFGTATVASGINSIAFSNGTASGVSSIALGQGTVASGDNSVAIGNGVSAETNPDVISIGRGFSSNTQDSLNIGFGSKTYVFTDSSIYSARNVGIGTTAPQQKLDVDGTIYGKGFQMPTGASAGKVLTANAAGVGTWTTPAPAGGTPGGSTTQIQYNNAGAFGGVDGFFYNGTSLSYSGNFGIGSTAPQKQLDIVGSENITGISGSNYILNAKVTHLDRPIESGGNIGNGMRLDIKHNWTGFDTGYNVLSAIKASISDERTVIKSSTNLDYERILDFNLNRSASFLSSVDTNYLYGIDFLISNLGSYSSTNPTIYSWGLNFENLDNGQIPGFTSDDAVARYYYNLIESNQTIGARDISENGVTSIAETIHGLNYHPSIGSGATSLTAYGYYYYPSNSSIFAGMVANLAAVFATPTLLMESGTGYNNNFWGFYYAPTITANRNPMNHYAIWAASGNVAIPRDSNTKLGKLQFGGGNLSTTGIPALPTVSYVPDVAISYDGTNWLFDVVTATNSIVFNDGSFDTDFRIEGDNDANLFYLNAGTDRVGIGSSSPNGKLTVGGGGTSGSALNIASDGTLTLAVDATVYMDVEYPVAIGKVSGANAPAFTTFNTTWEAYRFTVGDLINLGSKEMPHNWKKGSQIEWHLHWSTGSANYVSGDRVNWQIDYSCANPALSQPFTAFPATKTVTAETTFTTTVAPWSHIYTDMLPWVTPDCTEYGGQMVAKLTRIAKTGGTDPGTNPFAMGLNFHYEIDRIGSSTELTN